MQQGKIYGWKLLAVFWLILVTGAESMVRRALRLDASGAKWANKLADVVRQRPPGRTEVLKPTVSAAAARHPSDPDEPSSWVLAPVSRS